MISLHISGEHRALYTVLPCAQSHPKTRYGAPTAHLTIDGAGEARGAWLLMDRFRVPVARQCCRRVRCCYRVYRCLQSRISLIAVGADSDVRGVKNGRQGTDGGRTHLTSSPPASRPFPFSPLVALRCFCRAVVFPCGVVPAVGCFRVRRRRWALLVAMTASVMAAWVGQIGESGDGEAESQQQERTASKRNAERGHMI